MKLKNHVHITLIMIIIFCNSCLHKCYELLLCEALIQYLSCMYVCMYVRIHYCVFRLMCLNLTYEVLFWGENRRWYLILFVHEVISESCMVR